MMHGIINVYKEKGFTSHDVVAKLRGIAGQRKIGHTGTLDPDAEGVLPVCLGRATKVCDLLTEKDKTYEAVLLLGVTTDTQDISGEILESRDTAGIEEPEVQKAIMSFVGEYEQIPPMYSALKVNGKKLYELAREGKTVERKPRKVSIHSIRILEMELPRIRMEISCSKGTYIRTLCQDIGEKLGCGGCMEKLLRTRVSSFSLENSIKLSEIQKLKDQNRLEEILIPVDEVFAHYRKIRVGKEQEALLHNGNMFYIRDPEIKPKDQEQFRVYDCQDQFVAIYRYDEAKKRFQIVKMFFN
ncbi:tRNA pseudouridine(55) synthase TruB [Sporofaciens sp. SGI.106]|uniref:tRNA pseudouridine(55) synthase TruB n=1 Tax=Sporofaciens sp. SGI.106 TaxID=3420568 RepID=UPI003D090145